MNIKSVVVHEIKKAEKTTVAEIVLTDQALDHKAAMIINIVTKLDESFGKKTPKEQSLMMMDSKKALQIFLLLIYLKNQESSPQTLKLIYKIYLLLRADICYFASMRPQKNFLPSI